jgi:RND family efflux transporter MFP subunit
MKVRGLALLAIGTLLAGCGGGGKSAQQGAAPLAVDVTTAKRQAIATTITLDGQIAPLQQSTLSSTQSGTVTSVLVNEGDSVHAGQLLAQLDTSQLRATLAADEATANQAEAKLQGSNVLAPISSTQYTSAQSTAQQNLQAAQNRVSTDVAALRNAQLVFNSNEQLVKQGYVSQTAAEQARAAYVAAVAELTSARQALPAAQSALHSAQAGMNQTQVDQATIKQNEAALAQARADTLLTQTQINQSSIYAPFDGVVTQRLLDPGAYASPNAPIVTVSQLDYVYVNANVPDEDLGFVKEGTAATFTSQSLPGHTFSGKIFAVNATPTTGTLSYRARIKQPNPGRVLRGGMLVTVNVQKEFHPNAIVVPLTSVIQGDGGASIYTIVDGKAKAVPVTVGIQTDTLAEIQGSDVRPGMVVITARPDALQDGSEVAVSATPGAPKSTH